MLLAEKKIRLPLKSPFIEWDLRYLASYQSYIKVRFPADMLWFFGPVIFGSGWMARGNRSRVSDLSINQIELQGGPPIYCSYKWSSGAHISRVKSPHIPMYKTIDRVYNSTYNW